MDTRLYEKSFFPERVTNIFKGLLVMKETLLLGIVS